jgi:redox-sensitive bicupin YhaK (pirin superfamily)
MLAQIWLVKPRIMLLISQRTDGEIAVSQMVEHMHILIEVLTTSNEGEVKTHDSRENKIMLASWSKNSGSLC